MELTIKDFKFITKRLSGSSIKDAADEVGIPLRTVYRRMDQAEFKEATRRMAEIEFQLAASQICGISEAAVLTLYSLMRSKSDQVKLGAARAILDFASKFQKDFNLFSRVEDLELKVKHLSERGR